LGIADNRASNPPALKFGMGRGFGGVGAGMAGTGFGADGAPMGGIIGLAAGGGGTVGPGGGAAVLPTRESSMPAADCAGGTVGTGGLERTGAGGCGGCA
jgi:hypothetical protein